MNDPDLPRSKQTNGDCNATDGFSVCTEPPGHGPTHWDRRTQHEWSEDPESREALIKDWIARHPEADEKQIQDHEDAMLTFHPMWRDSDGA